MKKTAYLLTFTLLLIITGCSGKEAERDENLKDETKAAESTQSQQTDKTPPLPPARTAFQRNSSRVLARVLKTEVQNENNFTITVKLLESQSHDSLPSIASEGETLLLIPALILDERGMPESNEINQGLFELKQMKPGENFRAVISLDKDGRWVISEKLNN